MISCIIVEDQAPAQRVLKKFIVDYGRLDLKGTFSDAITTMEFLEKESVDLIFLDVHLPRFSGIDFLKTMTHKPAIVLTTAFTDYALEGYELDVIDYLLKPFSYDRFSKAVLKVSTRLNKSSANSEPSDSELFIKSGYDFVKVNAAEILYIKSDMDYTEVILPNKKLIASDSLHNWEQKLAAENFKRAHKSYLVNISKVLKISGNQLLLEGGNIVPIGRVFKEGLRLSIVSK